MARPLLIGLGAPEAGDDAAGRLVARGLAGRNPGFDIAETRGNAADLLSLFDGRARVLIVDACRSGAAPGTIHRIDATGGRLPAPPGETSSHGLGLAEALGLARALNLLPELCDLWAIEGVEFAPGGAMTPEVAEAVNRCVEAIPAVLSPAPPPVSAPER